MDEGKFEQMRLVVIESPYAGDVARNVRYAKACVRDCLARGESPYASRLFFTQEGLLDDAVPEERRLGIQAGLNWSVAAALRAVYVDLGITDGMRQAIRWWSQHPTFQKLEFRTLRSRLVVGVDDPFRLQPWEKEKHPDAQDRLYEAALAQAGHLGKLLSDLGLSELDLDRRS